MSDFKIRPPSPGSTPGSTSVQGASPGPDKPEAAGATKAPFQQSMESATAVKSTQAADPATIVEQIRSGEIEVEQAVDMLIERALEGPLVNAAPDQLRAEIRDALQDLVRDDPALAALMRAMNR